MDSTGRITGYKTAAGGADTVFPFSNLQHGSFAINAVKNYQIALGGRPKFLALVLDAPQKGPSIYSERIGHTIEGYDYDRGWLIVSDSGFSWNHASYDWGYGTAYYIYSMTYDPFDFLP